MTCTRRGRAGARRGSEGMHRENACRVLLLHAGPPPQGTVRQTRVAVVPRKSPCARPAHRALPLRCPPSRIRPFITALTDLDDGRAPLAEGEQAAPEWALAEFGRIGGQCRVARRGGQAEVTEGETRGRVDGERRGRRDCRRKGKITPDGRSLCECFLRPPRPPLRGVPCAITPCRDCPCYAPSLSWLSFGSELG